MLETALSYTMQASKEILGRIYAFKNIAETVPQKIPLLCVPLAKTRKLFSSEETLEQALSRLGERSYSLFVNNCEHFVLWCKTGRAESEQAERLKLLLSSIPFVGKGASLLVQPELRDEIKAS
jgi:hypothetical protein